MKFEEIISRIIGFGASGAALIILMVGIGDGHFPSEMFTADMILGSVGGLGVFNSIRLRKKRDEIKVLKYLSYSHGKATVAELVVNLKMPIDRVKKVIERLQKHGVIGVEVADDGEMLYSVSNSRTFEEKLLSGKVW
ncbi:hypothetical protein AAG747_21815 [Rapidithrix thailandica]|uniref:Uncharacterized protein n=1 Tax=Rapidithrix thailandica TaxID=413964 RepID=A0AAW9SDL8_9BACT